MRVALITTQDPADHASWSGTQYHVLQQLQKQFGTVTPLGPVKLNPVENLITRAISRILPRLCKYSLIHSLVIGWFRARHFSRKLREQEYDFAFASACCPVVAFLKTDIPIVYLSDATFNVLIDYYQQFTNLSRLSLFEGHQGERRALANASLALFSSDWAAQSAVKDYGAAPERVKVCLFGANIGGDVPDLSASETRLPRIGKRCDLLFLARDWHRKGGPVALEAFRTLKAQGYDVTLTICGCVPDKSEDIEGLTVIPYLNKGLEADHQRYIQLMLDSHFLVLPTVADCTPMVLAEANAFRMPVITSETGGIPSLVQEGVNGFLLPVDATGEGYARTIVREYFDKPEEYLNLAKTARDKYEKALNWDSWGERVSQLVESELTNSDVHLSNNGVSHSTEPQNGQ